jgi:hypothetical protein
VHINAHCRIKGVFDNLVKFVYKLGKNWQARAWQGEQGRVEILLAK